MGRLRHRASMLWLRSAHRQDRNRDRDRPRWRTPPSAASALLRHVAARTGEPRKHRCARPEVVVGAGSALSCDDDGGVGVPLRVVNAVPAHEARTRGPPHRARPVAFIDSPLSKPLDPNELCPTVRGLAHRRKAGPRVNGLSSVASALRNLGRMSAKRNGRRRRHRRARRIGYRR